MKELINELNDIFEVGLYLFRNPEKIQEIRDTNPFQK